MNGTITGASGQTYKVCEGAAPKNCSLLYCAGAKRGIRLTFEDIGPGISDIERAMTNGWTSGKGLGLGLPGAKRLVNEFEVQSTPGCGTRIVISRWNQL